MLVVATEMPADTDVTVAVGAGNGLCRTPPQGKCIEGPLFGQRVIRQRVMRLSLATGPRVNALLIYPIASSCGLSLRCMLSGLVLPASLDAGPAWATTAARFKLSASGSVATQSLHTVQSATQVLCVPLFHPPFGVPF